MLLLKQHRKRLHQHQAVASIVHSQGSPWGHHSASNEYPAPLFSLLLHSTLCPPPLSTSDLLCVRAASQGCLPSWALLSGGRWKLWVLKKAVIMAGPLLENHKNGPTAPIGKVNLLMACLQYLIMANLCLSLPSLGLPQVLFLLLFG